MSKVQEAEAFARLVHKDQKYSDGTDFIGHPQTVASFAYRFGLPEELQAAAWLHDVLEDTPTTREGLLSVFGPEITDLVWAVTDEPGQNRKERIAKTLVKTRQSSLGVALKLCDRMANASASCAPNSPPNFAKMYYMEYPTFYRALHVPGEWTELWEALDGNLLHLAHAISRNP